MEYANISEGMKQLFPGYVIPVPENKTNKNVLILLHSLIPGGAQVAALEIIPLLQQSGFQPWVLSYDGGEYKDQFMKSRIPCGILPEHHMEERVKDFFLNAFDLVILNSIASFPFAGCFIHTSLPVIWWIHETETFLQKVSESYTFQNDVSDNFCFAGAALKAREGIKNVFGKEAVLLPLPVADLRDRFHGEKGSCIRFMLPARFEPIKGQDLLLKAVDRLPPEYAEKSEFILCGLTMPEDQKYESVIRDYALRLPNVRIMGNVTREALYQMYASCDCVVAPSRMDLNPLSIIEGMMFEKLTIASDAAGISGYMTDCVNGFVFPSGNVEELFKRLLLVIAERTNLESVAAAGRGLYERHFSPEAAQSRLEELLERLIP